MNTYFTKEHEWVKVDGNIGAVGISEHAAHQLGDVTFVELPAAGKEVTQFKAFCGIESVKAASDIYAPVSGTIVNINLELEGTPELVNESPEEKGWIASIELSNPAELQALMNREQYEEYLR